MADAVKMPDTFEVPVELALFKANGTQVTEVPAGYSLAVTSSDEAVATFAAVESSVKGKAVAVAAGVATFTGTVTYPDGSVKSDTFELTVELSDAGVPRFIVGTPVPKG
jgi:beta-phosphoglucomutase-like phosphatase (HAD superfamily)